MSGKSILKPTIQVTAFSLVGIFLGFVNQIVLAYYFGSGVERDAYFAASTIPLYISAIFVGSVGAVFLSHYINVGTHHTDDDEKVFLNSVTNFCLITLGVISVLGIIFSKQILNISAPGFTGPQLQLASLNLKILFPTIVCTVLVSVFSSVYQSRHNFLIPALPAVITPVLSLGFVVLLNKNIGISSLSWGTLAGNALSLFILMVVLIKQRLYFFRWGLVNIHLKLMLASALPLLLAGFFYRFSSVWERVIASKLPAGSISYLGYGNQILAVMATVTTGGISTIFFPILAKAWSDNDAVKLELYFQKALRLILFVTVPTVALFLIVKVQLIQLFFERGAFDHQSTIGVSTTLAFMMGAFIFQSLGNVIVRAFYFMNMTIKSSVIATLEVISYIVFSYFFCRYFSYVGLALALSLSTMVNLTISAVIVNKRVNILQLTLFKNLCKVVLAGVAPALIIIYARSHYSNNNLFLTTGCYCLAYVVILYILRFDEVLNIQEMLKTKKNGN